MENERIRPILSIFLVALMLVGVTDLVLDRPESWLSFHVFFELAFIIMSAAFAIVLWQGWRRTTERLRVAESTLEARNAEREAWRAQSQKALDGMARAIDTQFAAWALTPTEREVALSLLKGLGHKEIAARTQRSERTVRQHAVSVYQKAGLSGRAELSAFFLQDLMLPAVSESGTSGNGA